MRRAEDWVERLERFFGDPQFREFRWGKNDCVLFACSGIWAMTGVDLAADFRGGYDSEIGAARKIRELAGEADNLEKLCEHFAATNNIAEVMPFFAHRGDAVLIEHPGGLSLALVALHGAEAVGIGFEGQTKIPMENWLRAWRIPF